MHIERLDAAERLEKSIGIAHLEGYLNQCEHRVLERQGRSLREPNRIHNRVRLRGLIAVPATTFPTPHRCP
jgi:hypothetical protein